MISLRHHAISLTAVFLALAVGVVLGSGLLSETFLSSLREERQQLQNQVNSLQDSNNALTEKVNNASEFDTAMAGRMVHNALARKSVVLFRTPDASDDIVDSISRLINEAGGKVTGTVKLTQQFVSADASEKLLSVVNSSILPPGAQLSTTALDQGSQAGDLLGIVLQLNRDPKAPMIDDTERETALAALRETGFITYSEGIAAADGAVVVSGGALGDGGGNDGPTVARFATALARHGSGTVLVGTDGSASGTAAVAVTRADPGMSGAVSTVDDADMESGRITVVLALHDLMGGGRDAHYGTGRGAEALTLAQ